MRNLTLAAAGVVALGLVVTWLSGGFGVLAQAAVSQQRELQNALAGAIRQLKAQEAGAVVTLVSLCFGYGVVHAIGPGHGKLLLGSYALATRATLWRLAGYSLAASLAQSAVAIALVYAGVLVFAWTRAQMTDMAERSLTAASHLMVGAIGLYLAVRSLRALLGTRIGPSAHAHEDHTQGHGAHCAAGCGHTHRPNLAQIDATRGWRDGLMLVAGVAVRPCSGALLVLLLCWRIGSDMAGIAGVLAMGLGTATITTIAAGLATTLREGAWASGLDTAVMRQVASGVGVIAGLMLVLVSAILARS